MSLRLQIRLFVVPGMLIATMLGVMIFAVHRYDFLMESLWFDKIMHTMGGIGSCLLACLIGVNLPYRWRATVFSVGIPLLGRVAGMFFGALWEAAEAAFPIITNYIPQGEWDTAFDLVFDYIGGQLSGMAVLRKAGWRPAYGESRTPSLSWHLTA